MPQLDIVDSDVTIHDEEETRKRILQMAGLMGYECEEQMKRLFYKFDTLLKNCKNRKERRDISKLAILEVYRLLDAYDSIYVDGEIITPRSSTDK